MNRIEGGRRMGKGDDVRNGGFCSASSAHHVDRQEDDIDGVRGHSTLVTERGGVLCR